MTQAQENNTANYLRSDLVRSLDRSHIDPTKLSTIQRIIITTDGTLTEILEAYLLEKLQVVKLSEAIVLSDRDLLPLELKSGEEIIQRKICLQGKISRVNWIYAESLIIPDRLDSLYREKLLKSQESIGRLWLEHRVETFKEIIDTAREKAEELATYFKIQPNDIILSRTYRVFSNRQPIMMITEKFPESFFK